MVATELAGGTGKDMGTPHHSDQQQPLQLDPDAGQITTVEEDASPWRNQNFPSPEGEGFHRRRSHSSSLFYDSRSVSNRGSVTPLYWSPPPEPVRPANPYRKGLELKVCRHEPPPPFGLQCYGDNPYPPGIRDHVRRKTLTRMTLVDLCLSQPPIEGVTRADEWRELEVVQELAVRDDHGAQVVVCRLKDDAVQGRKYVAKIFDPLYYSFADNLVGNHPRDTCMQADQDYAVETAAYEELKDSRLAGDSIPAYYGSWTFDMPLELPEPNGRQIRHVRMVLMEHVQGARLMLDMDPTALSDETRLRIVARVAEINAALINQGVYHDDVNQRNILVRLAGDDDAGEERVVLFDFNMAWVRRIDYQHSWYDEDWEEHKEFTALLYGPHKPFHPATHHWDRVPFWQEFKNWLPDRFQGESMRPYQEWLLEAWRDSPEWSPLWEPALTIGGYTPRDTATAGNTTVNDSQQNNSNSSSSDSTTWVLIAIIVGLVALVAISVFVTLRMLRLRERRLQQHQHQQQQQRYGKDDDHHMCDETGRLSPYLHAAPPQQRKLSKLSEADRRSWGEHVEQEQRAMMIRKSLASRSADFPGGRRHHSDSVSSSDSGGSFVEPFSAASRPATSSEAMSVAAAAQSNLDVAADREKDEEEQQFPAGGLRDDWKAFEAQLHLDKSLSRETHPAAAGRGS
ncbi:hypothetical protein PgNI_06505 [Pyricularia grisea]|uniref:Protein kinase domain-containing protein n=1 Tax=Pyricularia grisea TaxID=148305 RepID=A0A6P8B7U5_PYRGI|nr:hypothetical protein PgNI_06505 [Pyricularia grisea]TLD11350.1 hypothetical protein PgNI_06505 [Pyricularia grisea]